jgi:GT2 family glycosyltransferase
VTSTTDAPFFSLIIPVLDGGEAFGRVLAAIGRTGFVDLELIVVDDGSTDGSSERARRAGARILETEGRRGPAAARNAGASQARGRYLFFLDADCELHSDALGRAAAILRSDPEIDALFGSYDDDPAVPGAVSRYRNLLHHRVHQRSRPEASTFWAGCGAVRRSVFEEAGGFDAGRYPRPSVEDIDLGVRLHRAGRRIRLDKDVLVTHLKGWTLWSMIRTDALQRAAPWTELALRSGGFPRDLNTRHRERVGLAAVAVTVASAFLALWEPALLAVTLVAGLAFALAHLDLFRFLRRRGGTFFALLCLPLHGVHLLAGGAGLLLGAARHLFRNREPRQPAGNERSGASPSSDLQRSRSTRNPAGPRA